MTKEVIAYILLFFGVVIAVIGTVFYLRMYKAMIGSQKIKQYEDSENTTNIE